MKASEEKYYRRVQKPVQNQLSTTGLAILTKQNITPGTKAQRTQ